MAACTSVTLMDRIKFLSTLPIANYMGVCTALGTILALSVYSWTLPNKIDEKPGNYFKK